MPGMIRKRGQNSWQISVSAGFDLATGRRIRIWRTIRGTRKDAERALAKLLNEVAHGLPTDPGKTTVDEWLRRWLEVKRPMVSPKTYETYEFLTRLYLIPALGRHRLSQLHPYHVQEMLSKLLEAGKHPKTALHVFRTLHAALADAVRQQILSRNICDSVRPPKVPVREPRVLTEEELQRLLKAAEGTRLHIPILLAALAGLRRGEVLGLLWLDADLERGVLYVRRALEETRSGLVFKEPKTNRFRAVVLPPVVVEALREHRRTQVAERLKAGPSWQDYDLVCPARNGVPWRPSNFKRDFEAFVRKNGFEGLTFHALRHTHASLLIRSGADLKVVASRLGHSTPRLTLDTYAHLLPGAQEDAVRRLMDRLGKANR
jgi:integrase